MIVPSTSASPSTFGANGLSGFLAWALATHRRAVAGLVLICLLAFLPGFFNVPPVDRDEARFAQATKQMIETGDYLDIRFRDEARNKKPIGIYWLQAAFVKGGQALGVPRATMRIWLYRMPSLFGAVGAVLLTYWTALAFVSRRAAALAALMLASSILLGVEARLAKTDAMLLLTVTAAMGALARVYFAEKEEPGSGGGWAMPAIFWTALAAGVLIKGPVNLMIVGLTIAALAILDRSVAWLKALRPLPGLAWLLLLVLPWFVAIMWRTGGGFLADSLGQDMMAKVTSGQESHGAPPGTYVLMFWATFFPGAALAGMAAPAVWAARREPAAQFLLAWLVPSWIVFELVATKLPHYVLPLYPAVAILIAGVVDQGGLSRNRWLAYGPAWWFAVPTLIAIGSVVALIMLGHRLGFSAWPFLAAAVIMGLLAWRLFEVDGPERALLRAVAAAILVVAAVDAFVVPTLGLFPSARVERALRAIRCPSPAVVSAGYDEPSLVFFVGASLRTTDASSAADFLAHGSCRVALVEARQERGFLQRADALGVRYKAGPRIEGFNISNGRAVSIAIYTTQDAL